MRHFWASLFVVVCIGCAMCFGCAGAQPPTCADDYLPSYSKSVTLRRFTSPSVRVWFDTNARLYTITREELVLSGFYRWETATRNGISVVPADSSKDADIIVLLTDDIDTNCSPSRTGCTNLRYRGRKMEEATIRLDPTTGDAPGIAAHEFGHALGIDGHSPSRGDLMYLIGRPSGQPSLADVNVIRAAYCQNFTSPLDAN
jgi:hypothetical protein